eukprot:c20978_g1_i1 orf=198-827(-)
MGASGAGKTTLMDVLAGRKTGGYIEGDIRISGFPKKQETFARISGYCEQNDIHSPQVTVYESLLFSAWLRLSSEISLQDRQVRTELSGLSNEQRKRLTIAVELVANPSIIFMDEPTSGLDARSGWWIWYYWICPVAWSVYGIICSQYGDVDRTITSYDGSEISIKQVVENTLGFHYDFLGVVAAVLVGFTLFFAGIYVLAVKRLNFQNK